MPSSRKSLLEAITFVRFVLGVQDLKSLGESRRCYGSARQKEFRARKQASPFSVDELTRLHLVLEKDPEPWNRVMAGAVLLAVYGRTALPCSVEREESERERNESERERDMHMHCGTVQTLRLTTDMRLEMQNTPRFSNSTLISNLSTKPAP